MANIQKQIVEILHDALVFACWNISEKEGTDVSYLVQHYIDRAKAAQQSGAADVARPLDAKGASMRDAFCNICKMYTSFSDQTSSYGLLVMGGVVTREKFKQKSPICSKCARRIKDKLTQK